MSEALFISIPELFNLVWFPFWSFTVMDVVSSSSTMLFPAGVSMVIVLRSITVKPNLPITSIDNPSRQAAVK